MHAIQGFRRSWRFLPALAMVLALGFAARGAMAQYVAWNLGTWSNVATWNPAGVPGSGDSAIIGDSPAGPYATAASVTLNVDPTVGTVYLGYGSGSSGTLNLAGHHLTVTGGLHIGPNYTAYTSGGIGTIIEDGGSFSASTLMLDSANSLALGPSDTVGNANVSGSSYLMTTASGNINAAGAVTVAETSTFTMGAPLVNINILNVEEYSTLNMGGRSISAGAVILGWYDGQPVTVQNQGAITATNLFIAYGTTFTFTTSDVVTNLYLTNSAQGTTTAAGNVTGNVSVNQGSTLTLGTAMTLTGNSSLDVERGSTLNMAGHSISAPIVELGWGASQWVTVLNRGPISTANLYVYGQAWNLNAADAVTNFSLSNGTSTLNSPVSTLTLSNSARATTTPLGVATVQGDIGST